jgi:hypothetical protein
MNPKIELENLLAERTNTLAEYAKRENAKESYINSQNLENRTIQNCINQIPKFSNYWLECEKEWEYSQKINPKIGLQINICNGGEAGDYLSFNKNIEL